MTIPTIARAGIVGTARIEGILEEDVVSIDRAVGIRTIIMMMITIDGIEGTVDEGLLSTGQRMKSTRKHDDDNEIHEYDKRGSIMKMDKGSIWMVAF